MDISIIIPTKNRYEYIKKLICYYDNIRFSGKLIIVDSSEVEVLNKTKELISQKKLQIIFVEYNSDEIDSKSKICKYIKTKYVVQSGDDDYFSPEGLKRIIEFLNDNKDYSSASGYGYSVGFNIKKKNVHGLSVHNIMTSEKNNAFERVKDWKIHGSVADYVVCRKEIYLKILNNIWYEKDFPLYLIRLYWEYTFKFYLFLYGKIKELDKFYLVRLRIPENAAAFPKNKNLLFLNDKKRFFEAYYKALKRFKLVLINHNENKNNKIFLLAKKEIKKDIFKIMKTSNLSYLDKLQNKFEKITILIINLIFKLKKPSISQLINKNSKNYNKDFEIIINNLKN